MNAMIAVMKKELLDLFRDRKTVAISLLMGPLLFPALILGLGKLASNRVFDSSKYRPRSNSQQSPRRSR